MNKLGKKRSSVSKLRTHEKSFKIYNNAEMFWQRTAINFMTISKQLLIMIRWWRP